jgi:hypothetical protein
MAFLSAKEHQFRFMCLLSAVAFLILLRAERVAAGYEEMEMSGWASVCVCVCDSDLYFLRCVTCVPSLWGWIDGWVLREGRRVGAGGWRKGVGCVLDYGGGNALKSQFVW